MSTKPTTYFIYARKSSESEDRQVASIDAQIEELLAIAKADELPVLEVLQESYSAKAPGRPVFSYMLDQIKKGKAAGILCWKLDRLARNPVDGGQVLWMLQEEVIQHIRTYERHYYPTDNVLMMNVEFGMANQYIRDLSVNVKRGLRKSVRRGIRPSRAPIGYLNAPDRTTGSNIIIEDPDRFPLVKRMWELFLSGTYSVEQIRAIANNKWGLRTVKHKKLGGRPLARSALYHLFKNPFYYGWFEWPRGSGEWYKGAHMPMITQGEYDRVQIMLGSDRTKPIPKKKEFAFTGMIRCGECGCQVTAEEKVQMICSMCQHKFALSNKTHCPGCGIHLDELEFKKILRYTYYHCTKHKSGYSCSQRGVEVSEIVKAVDEFLEPIAIDKDILKLAIQAIESDEQYRITMRDTELALQKSALIKVERKLSVLLDMRLEGQLAEPDYINKQTQLLKQKDSLARAMASVDTNCQQREESLKKVFDFACYARAWLRVAIENDDRRWMREILTAVSSNLTLTNKKLEIIKRKWMLRLEEVLKQIPEEATTFEPTKSSLVASEFTHLASVNPSLLADLYATRTDENWQIPEIPLSVKDEKT